MLTIAKGTRTFASEADAIATELTYRFTTPTLAAYGLTVLSKLASDATDGAWSSATFRKGVAINEVPSDANMTVSFSGPVDTDLLVSALELVPRVSPLPPQGRLLQPALSRSCAITSVSYPQSLTRSPCAWCVQPGTTDPPPAVRVSATREGCSSSEPQRQSCASIAFTAPLAIDSQYDLRIRKGAAYHPAAGLSAGLSLGIVSGPFSFQFAFVEDTQNTRPSYRRWALTLRHGLDSTTTLRYE